MTEVGSTELTATQEQPTLEAGPTPVTWAPVVRVNLLPLEVLERRAFRRVQIGLAVGVVLVIGAIGTATVWAHREADQAQATADAAAARVTQLQQQQAEYSEVPRIYAQVEAAAAARRQVFVGDVPWSRYINQLDRARPSTVEYRGLQMTLATAASAPVDPLTPVAVATLAIEGQSSSYAGVADWMAAFDQIRGFQSSVLKSATRNEETGVTTFSATGVVGARSLSGRYQETGSAAGESTGS